LFRATHPNASKLKKIFQALVKLSDEIPFFVSSSGIEIKVLSPDKTILAVVSLPGMEFEELVVEEETQFIVPTSELKKIIRRASRNDVVTLTINKETGELVMILRDRKQGLKESLEYH